MGSGGTGKRIVAGRYRLREHLGSGGMGTVWRAHDRLLDRAVAVKEVSIPDGVPPSEAERLRERYLREARAAARLRHSGVVGVYDVISETGRVWIVMELVHAPNLAQVLRRDGPLPPQRAARLGLNVLAALEAAHAAGVLHRDVKPANVLVCDDGHTVLTDFGVASVAGDPALTRTGQLMGSPAYLAPERLTGSTATPASDLWSLGCLLYAAVEGRTPFGRGEHFAVITAITLEPVPPAGRAGLLGPVLTGLLDKNPAIRWDAARTRAALERVAEGQPVPAGDEWGGPAVAAATGRAGAAPAGTSGASGGAQAPTWPGPPDGPGRHASPPRRLLRRAALAVLGPLLVVTLAGGAGVALRESGVWPALRAGHQPAPTASDQPASRIFVNTAQRYEVRYPAGWTAYCADARQTGCLFNALPPGSQADDRRVTQVMNLRITVLPADGRDALAVATAHDAAWRRDAARSAGYTRVALGEATFGGNPGAILEYTFVGRESGRRRQVRIFVHVVDGRSYEISLNGPADEFAGTEDAFGTMAESFRTTA